MVAMEAAAWLESVRGLCAWNVWHDLSGGLATAGMQHLRALARFDSRYIAEVALVAPGLLAAAQIRRRRERQQQQQREYEQHKSRLWPGRRRPKARLLGWQEGVFCTFALAFGSVVFIYVGRGVLAEPLLPGVEEATHRVSGAENGVPLGESLMVAIIVAAACYAVTGFSGFRRLLDHWSVQTPLGITAELLRACHVSTAAAIALALAPPLLSVAVSENGPVSQEDAAVSRVVVGSLGMLRLLASLVAGAAVSCIGGGGWACSSRRRRAPEVPHVRRSIVDPGGSMASLPEECGVTTGGGRRIDGGGMFADTIKDSSGVEVNGGVQELRRDGGGVVETLFSTWFVPSGALGGAFYAITAGGVFGGLFQDFFSGKDWFASPQSARWTLAMVYAVVFTLRSIAEISEANGSVDGAAGFTSTPLLPLFRLLGLKASSKNLAQGISSVGSSGQRVALNRAARHDTEQLADEVTAGQSRSPRRAFSSAKHSGATAIAALDGVQKEQQLNGETRSRGLGWADATANASKAMVNAGAANAAEYGRSGRRDREKEDESDLRRGRRPRLRRSVSDVVETRTRIETEYRGAVGVGVGVGVNSVGRGGGSGRSKSRGGGGSVAFSMWLELVETWAFPSVLLVLLVCQVALAVKRRYWADKGFDAVLSSFRIALFDGVGSALLLRFPRGVGAGIFVAALTAAARVRSAAEKVDPTGCLPCITHGSALTYVGAFGGDFLASACLGSRAMVLTEEGAIPSAIFAWLLVGGRLWGGPGPFSPGLRGFMSFVGVHHALVVLAEAFRALLVCRAVESAKKLSEGGVGGSWTLAFVAGVLAGYGGMFLTGNRGLSPLSKAAPWALQSALYGSAFYYFADTSTLPAQAQAQAVLAMCFSVVAIARTSRRLGPTFNPLSPIHRAVCRLLGVKVSLPAARVQPFSRIQAPAAIRRSAAAVEADPLATKGRISSARFSTSRSRLGSFSPTPGRSAATTMAAGPCSQRSLSFSSPRVRVGSSRNMGVRTEAAAAAKTVAALPAERLGSRGQVTRRRLSMDGRRVSPLPVVPDDRVGFELGSSRTRALSMCSRTLRRANTHADGSTGESRGSDRRDRHNRGRPISQRLARSRSISDVLTRGPARRERSRLEEGGEVEAGRRREAGLWVDGEGFGARGVGRAVAWAAVAASLIALGRWLALTAQPGTVHPLSPHGHERDTREAKGMATLGGDIMIEPSRVPPSGLLVLLALLQARSDRRYNLSFFDGDGDGETARSSYLGKGGGGADMGEKIRSSSISSSTVLSLPEVGDCSEAVVGEFSKVYNWWMGEVAEGQDLDASVTVDSCGHGPATSVAPPTSSHAKANETPLEPLSLNSSVDGCSVVAPGEDRMNQAMTERKADETGTQSLDPDRQPESTHCFARAPDAGVTAFDASANPESLADGIPMNSPEEMETGAPGTRNGLSAMRSGGGGDAPRDTARESESKNLPPLREGSVLDEGDVVGASAADCGTSHVTVGEEYIDGRSPTGMMNAATAGEPQDGSEGGKGEGIENLDNTENTICADGSSGCISSENRAREDSDGTGLEAAAFPSRFVVAEPPSSHAPKYRPWRLPERAPSRFPADKSSIAPISKYVTPGIVDFLRGFSDAPPPLITALVGAVDSPPPSWARPTNTPSPPENDGEEARPIDSAADNLPTARLGVEEELPLKTVSPDVLEVDSDAREGGTISPPPPERPARTTARTAVALVATVAYYGAWAAITLALG